MKTRHGFVSNSSSASFIIKKKGLPIAVINAIKNHWQYANDHHFHNIQSSYVSEHDKWHIDETDEAIMGDTVMDNFDMQQFLEELFEQHNLPFVHFEKDG